MFNRTGTDKERKNRRRKISRKGKHRQAQRKGERRQEKRISRGKYVPPCSLRTVQLAETLQDDSSKSNAADLIEWSWILAHEG